MPELRQPGNGSNAARPILPFFDDALVAVEAQSKAKGGFPWLPPRTVHLWLFDTDTLSLVSRLTSMVMASQDEQRRASLLRNPLGRKRFLVGRGMIRRILGQYCDTDPSDLRFDVARYGKPQLRSSHFHVNWSHAGSVWLLGISASGTVGVDIETAEHAHNWQGPMSIAYAEWEKDFVLNKPDSAADRFLTIWTLKEALFKATGQGLHDTISSVSVVGPDLAIRPWLDLAEGRRWHLQCVSLAHPFRAAIAASFPIVHLEVFRERSFEPPPHAHPDRCYQSSLQIGSSGGEKQ